jgi:branched-chain amino acid transport system ATP-binding protein
MLTVENVQAFYGHIQALRGVSVEAQAGEIVTLIGANGAGKSTLLMTICGNPRAATGRVLLDGEDITAWPTHRIAHSGIAHAPEGRRIFARMTVLENLMMGDVAAADGGAGSRARMDKLFDLFPRLAERRTQRGGTLSGGEQQMLAIGRALMSAPRLLLLDEPSLGLAPIVVRSIFDAIAALNRDEGLTVFLVEQNAHLALRIAHRGYVMVNGEIALSGPAAELAANEQVRAAYLEGGAA